MSKINPKKKLKSLLLLAMLTLSATVGAQDIGFSQFYANPLYLNPAFAGSAVAPRISLTYRSQWPGLVSAFTTVSASYDQYFPDLHGGLGFIILTDRQGDHGALSTSMAGAMYSFRFQVGRDIYVSAALQASLVLNHLNWNEYLRFPDQIDQIMGFAYPTGAQKPDKVSQWSADFNAGLLVSGSQWYAGLAAAHLTQPNQAFYSDDPVPMKFTVHAGGLINVAEESRRQSSLGLGSPIISPNLVYQFQNGFNYFNYGLYLDWQPFLVGVWCGRRSRYLWLVLAWFVSDMVIHVGFGFALNEVYTFHTVVAVEPFSIVAEEDLDVFCVEHALLHDVGGTQERLSHQEVDLLGE